MPSDAAGTEEVGTFQEALRLYRQGGRPVAEALLARLLERQPDHFDALYLMGLIALQSARAERAAAFIERALHARGIDLTLKSVTNAKLFLPKSAGGALATGAFDLAYVPWPMGADPDDSFLLTCAGSGNVMRWCDPQVDALERRALVAPEQAERKALYAAIEQRVAAAVPIVYLFDPSYIYAYRTALRGFAPNAFNPTWNAADWRL